MLAVPASRVASSPAPVRRIARTRRRAISTRARAAVSGTDAGLPSLTDASTWRLRFDLYSGKDPSATTPDRVVAVDVKFVVDEGYEPPQGVLQIVDDPEGILVADGRHRWTLEEDPNERKAGLWIWGLFEEPLYPYLLLTLEANRVEVAEDGYHVPAGRLLGEMRHARGSKQGSVLTDGLLRFEVTKTYQADLVGLSKVTVGEPTTCGRLRADCLETR